MSIAPPPVNIAEPVQQPVAFGLLAVEIAVNIQQTATSFNYAPVIGGVLLVVALIFVWRSFYAMRIPREGEAKPQPAEAAAASHSTGIQL